MDVPTIPARSIVIKNKSTAWFGTRYTMNIYRGCSHGCIYCDSRSECYGVQDFDTVRVKSDALAVIRNDLRSKTQSGVVATGSMSDPYNPFEKELQLTRHALELLDAYGFGAAVATKGTLITRDADILREIDPVVGRGTEVRRLIQILSRRTKNNPVLVGEPGVGKTAIAEGLAQKIVNREVPEDMQGKRLMMLDMGALVAGTKYRGEFEDRSC